MWESQDGRCAICLLPETATWKGVVKMLAVDHDHQTGKIRGLLCAKCNTLAGHSQENLAILRAVIEYLKRHKR
jgi:hypothetical protein